jgi:hypothetical protein
MSNVFAIIIIPMNKTKFKEFHVLTLISLVEESGKSSLIVHSCCHFTL